MNMKLCKKTLFIALLFVVIVGAPVFADVAEAREAVAKAEAAVAEAREALADAKTAVAEAEAALADAEAALADAEAVLAEMEAAESEGSPEYADVPEEAEEYVEEKEVEEPEECVAEKEAEETEEYVAEKEVEETPEGEDIDCNEYFLESQRLLGLAREANDAGDYDAAAEYAEEAARYAELSDKYIAQKLGDTLPARYTVRKWEAVRDCFWVIAGYPWVYGDSFKWRVLYEANKSKLPNPNNPNLVEPGTVLDIPAIRGETRQGAWEEGKTYPPLP